MLPEWLAGLVQYIPTLQFPKEIVKPAGLGKKRREFDNKPQSGVGCECRFKRLTCGWVLSNDDAVDFNILHQIRKDRKRP